MGYLRNRGTRAHPEWYIRYKDVDGKWKQRHSQQASKDKARDILADAEARVKRGDQGIVDPTPADRSRKSITVEELARRFVGDVSDCAGYAPPRIKDLDAYRGDARSAFKVQINPSLGSRAAASVALEDVERLRDLLLARGLAAATVMHALAALSKLFNWGRRAKLVEVANPVQGVERPRPVASLDYLDAAEVGRLLAHADELARIGVASWQSIALHPMIATAVYCGLRKGELFGLRWSDVDLDAARLDVLRSYRLLPKSGKARHVPIHADLSRTLRVWRDLCPSTPDALVFPVEVELAGGARRPRTKQGERRPCVLRMGSESDMMGIAELLAAAKCHAPADGKPWHMLRHTFAAHAVMSGASLYAVQRLLGHASPQMTQRYAHLAPSFMAAEVARMSFAPPAPAGTLDMAEARRKLAVEQAGE